MIYNYPGSFPYRREQPNYYNKVPYARTPSYNHTGSYNPQKHKKNEQVIQKENIPSSKTNPESNEFFEIFGLKLYFDDILLICLIFFLYNEGVNDYYLFIALVLLLLS